jgi:hypothetical protein
MQAERPRTVGRLRYALLGAVAALMLIGPAQAAANPGDTFAEAKAISPGDASTGPIPGFDNAIWHVYASGPTPPASVTLSACDIANFDSGIIVSTGADAVTQIPILGGVAENGCGSSNRARLKFAPTPSTDYYVRVVNHDISLHTYNLYFNVTPANDDLANPLVLPALAPTSIQDSSGATKEALEPDHGGVSPVAGDNSLWYSWTSPASPVTATVNACASNVPVALGVYTGSTYAALPPVTPEATSNQCKTVFTTAATTTYRFAVAGINDVINAGGRDGQFHISVATPPANDNVAGAEPLTPAIPIDVLGDNSGATLEPSELHGSGYEFSIWYSWTPSASGPVAIDTCDPVNVSLDRVDLYATGGAPTTPIASADTGCGNGNGKLITTVTAGTPYFISISSAAFGGATRLKIDASTAPPPGGGSTGGGTTTPPTVTPTPKKKCKKKKKHASAAKKCKKKKKH